MIPKPAESIFTKKADVSDYAISSSLSKIVLKANYIEVSGSLIVSSLDLIGGGPTGSLGVNSTFYVSSSQSVDNIPTYMANSVKWFVFIESGSNSRATKVVASWNNSDIRSYEMELRQIGDVPVDLSATNNGTNVSLIATPSAGSWGIRLIRILI